MAESVITGRFGHISAVDAGRHMARVAFLDIGIISGWLPVAVFGAKDTRHEWMPDVGEHVYCILEDNTGIILCSIYDGKNKPKEGNQDKRLLEFKDGTRIEYDRSGHVLKMDVQGDIEINATGAVYITAGSDIAANASGHMGLNAAKIDLN